MDHYYSSQPSSKSNPQEMKIKLEDMSLTIKTDAGVFSKDKKDLKL